MRQDEQKVLSTKILEEIKKMNEDRERMDKGLKKRATTVESAVFSLIERFDDRYQEEE